MHSIRANVHSFKCLSELTGLCSNFFRNHSENFRRESLSHEAPTDQISEKINHGSINSPIRSIASGTACLSD